MNIVKNCSKNKYTVTNQKYTMTKRRNDFSGRINISWLPVAENENIQLSVVEELWEVRQVKRIDCVKQLIEGEYHNQLFMKWLLSNWQFLIVILYKGFDIHLLIKKNNKLESFQTFFCFTVTLASTQIWDGYLHKIRCYKSIHVSSYIKSYISFIKYITYQVIGENNYKILIQAIFLFKKYFN